MSSDPFAELGAFLTGGEAEALSARIRAGQPLAKALLAINPTRRKHVRQLLERTADSPPFNASCAALDCLTGAKRALRGITPVWTMPDNEATVGRLTSEFHRIVESARLSVVCASYNFEKTSAMWQALRSTSQRPGVGVVVYIDGDKADGSAVKKQLPQATVYRSSHLPDGRPIISHAKFIIVDHELTLLTSANFSYSAENRNVELGLLVQDHALAESIETTMATKHGTLYELVKG